MQLVIHKIANGARGRSGHCVPSPVMAVSGVATALSSCSRLEVGSNARLSTVLASLNHATTRLAPPLPAKMATGMTGASGASARGLAVVACDGVTARLPKRQMPAELQLWAWLSMKSLATSGSARLTVTASWAIGLTGVHALLAAMVSSPEAAKSKFRAAEMANGARAPLASQQRSRICVLATAQRKAPENLPLSAALLPPTIVWWEDGHHGPCAPRHAVEACITETGIC
mmetsp:Transcript_19953/g.35408  ORF Transcript_19953/g.35408 Transcript_19953/m.35408 type:complete len:230 (+) Transcript_19953:1292-1981(+)